MAIWKFMYRSEGIFPPTHFSQSSKHYFPLPHAPNPAQPNNIPESLKQQHIIPRTPSPSLSPSLTRSPSPERDADGFTAAQRQEIEAEKARMEAELRARFAAQDAARRERGPRIKRERTDDDKRQGSGEPAARRRRRNGPVEMVDLTGDDE